jgi:hypothetical protein
MDRQKQQEKEQKKEVENLIQLIITVYQIVWSDDGLWGEKNELYYRLFVLFLNKLSVYLETKCVYLSVVSLFSSLLLSSSAGEFYELLR